MAILATIRELLTPKDLRNDPEMLRQGVRQSYSGAANNPKGHHPFPVGHDFALRLGYPQELLATIPSRSRESFVGVANVAIFAELPIGAAVLDIGCGAGLDALIAARRVGTTGKVTGLDFSPAMLALARESVREAGLANLEFICGEAERLPLADRSVDIVLVNGIFNLAPDRAGVFREIARVIKPAGRVYAAELVLTGPLKPKRLRSLDDWFS
ncbi:MAG: methyltransferase domain-containing protein [Desulfobulbaceae bacterium]|nr:methyltransferase domain-containing protein [Desulfobulbaceae bacterium]